MPTPCVPDVNKGARALASVFARHNSEHACARGSFFFLFFFSSDCSSSRYDTQDRLWKCAWANQPIQMLLTNMMDFDFVFTEMRRILIGMRVLDWTFEKRITSDCFFPGGLSVDCLMDLEISQRWPRLLHSCSSRCVLSIIASGVAA